MFILPSSSGLSAGLMATSSGGITGGTIPTIIRTGTTPGGTGTGGITGNMIIYGILGILGFIAGFTGTTGGIGPHGGLSSSIE